MQRGLMLQFDSLMLITKNLRESIDNPFKPKYSIIIHLKYLLGDQLQRMHELEMVELAIKRNQIFSLFN